MKTPEKIYLDTDDYHEFKYNIEYVNQERKREEDVEYIRIDKAIELAKEAYEDGIAEGVNVYPEGSSIPSKKVMSFDQWYEQEKPLDK